MVRRQRGRRPAARPAASGRRRLAHLGTGAARADGVLPRHPVRRPRLRPVSRAGDEVLPARRSDLDIRLPRPRPRRDRGLQPGRRLRARAGPGAAGPGVRAGPAVPGYPWLSVARGTGRARRRVRAGAGSPGRGRPGRRHGPGRLVTPTPEPLQSAHLYADQPFEERPMAEPVALYSVDGPVATVTLNRPAARNAISSELLTRLVEAMAAADADEEVRAIILTGADPAFCAGVDLKE